MFSLKFPLHILCRNADHNLSIDFNLEKSAECIRFSNIKLEALVEFFSAMDIRGLSLKKFNLSMFSEIPPSMSIYQYNLIIIRPEIYFFLILGS